MMRRHLYLQIYLGFCGILILFALVATVWAVVARPEMRRVPPFLAASARLAGDQIPGGDAPGPQISARLTEIAGRLGLDACLWDAAGTKVAGVGRPLPSPDPDRQTDHWMRAKGGPHGITVRLDDGRWLGLAMRSDHRHRAPRWLLTFVLLAGIVAIGAYPVSRRIAGRIERLQTGVDRLAGGELDARVPVEGCDEIATLADSFNRAAERIESLVSGQRRMLASASHELRSPLARLRMTIELLQGGEVREGLYEDAVADIAELDELIEDLLLAARLETRSGKATDVEDVVLLDLVAEEGARVNALVTGETAQVRGERRLLRRLVRNLLENARRYGGDTPIEVSVATRPDGDGAILHVADHGPGIPAEERERIFEAFYRPASHSEGRDGGVGLGLALVREIARHHGGDVRATPRDGGGTVFEVELPGVTA